MTPENLSEHIDELEWAITQIVLATRVINHDIDTKLYRAIEAYNTAASAASHACGEAGIDDKLILGHVTPVPRIEDMAPALRRVVEQLRELVECHG